MTDQLSREELDLLIEMAERGVEDLAYALEEGNYDESDVPEVEATIERANSLIGRLNESAHKLDVYGALNPRSDVPEGESKARVTDD